MRFMVMHKVDATMEAGGPPSQQIISSMGALVQESLKNGTFTTGAGLHRSARRARLECRGEESTVTKGPYAGKNELLSSFAMIKASSLDEATARARQFARVLGDPFTESKELIAGFSILDLPNRAAAIAWADRYAAILADSEVDVRELED